MKPAHFVPVQTCPEGGQAIISLDVASSVGNNASYTAGLLFQKFPDVSYLRHILRGRFEYGELKRNVLALHKRLRPLFLIEAASLGMSLVSDLRSAGANVLPMNTGPSSKEERLLSVLDKIEAKYIRPVEGIVGLPEFLEECFAFPFGTNDDQVDALSQYLRWVRERDAAPAADLIIHRVVPRVRPNSRAATSASVRRMVR